MTKAEKENWLINLENAAADVASEYGADVVKGILSLYNVHSIEDLSPCYYSEIFSELYAIASDN
ncbi:MAG: hypothetical protein ACI4TF_06980 [Oliverpabstia sp.]